jgi:hypothetical protein
MYRVLILALLLLGGMHRPSAGHAASFMIAHTMLSAAGFAQTSAPDSGQTPPTTPETPPPSQHPNPPAADQATSSPSNPSPTAAQAPADGAAADAANGSAKSAKGKSQPKPASSSKKSAKKPKATPAEDPSPKKVVVKDGGTKDTKAELSPTMTSEQVSHARLDTTQLLASTDTNLQKIIGRQLNTSQQATLQQIHTFMQQAKDAADKGDLQRAHNLAMKAHLLSDDLAGH